MLTTGEQFPLCITLNVCHMHVYNPTGPSDTHAMLSGPTYRTIIFSLMGEGVAVLHLLGRGSSVTLIGEGVAVLHLWGRG